MSLLLKVFAACGICSFLFGCNSKTNHVLLNQENVVPNFNLSENTDAIQNELATYLLLMSKNLENYQDGQLSPFDTLIDDEYYKKGGIGPIYV